MWNADRIADIATTLGLDMTGEKMKKTIFIIITITLILSACTSPATPAPTETATMTATLAPPTKTPIPPTPTQIPATSTPEGVEWITVENIEDYADNPLTLEDFEPGGKVDTFFEEDKPEIIAGIDWDNIDDGDNWATIHGQLVPRKIDGDKIIRGKKIYEDTETNPFIRDFDAFGEIIVGKNRYIFMPLIILDKENQEIHFIKLAFPLQRDGVAFTQKQIDDKIAIWLENMNVSVIDADGKSFFAEQPDPLFIHKEDERFDEIVDVLYALADGNFSRLNEVRDIIFLTDILLNENHMYE